MKKATAADAEPFDSFGTSVALNGDTAVVGALGEETGGLLAGAAYVLLRSQGGTENWGEVKKLTASDAEENDFFGISVAVSGDNAIVGAQGEDTGGSDAGAAYVFHRHQGGTGNWGELKKLTASDPATLDNFGAAVAISGDTAIAGALGEDTGADEASAAYIYRRDQGGAGNWGYLKKVTASDAAEDNGFGAGVAISGDAVVVGATLGDSSVPNTGAAYVLQRDLGGANNWGQAKKITASDAQADDGFGASVAFAEDTAVLGAAGEDAGGAEAGAAYIFGDTDTDADGIKDLSDNCPTAVNPAQPNAVHPATFAGDHCENPDNDGLQDVNDGCPDDADNDSDADAICVAATFQAPETAGGDNCPDWANPTQALPSWSVPAGDTDCDGYPNTATVASRGRENLIGTDAADHCADTTAPNDERGPAFGQPLSPWSPDINDTRVTNLSDVILFGPHFNKVSPDPAYSVRVDLNASGSVTLSDVVGMGAFFNKSCA